MMFTNLIKLVALGAILLNSVHAACWVKTTGTDDRNTNFYGWFKTQGYYLKPTAPDTLQTCLNGAVPADAVWVTLANMSVTGFQNKLFKSATALKGISLNFNGLSGSKFSCDSFSANLQLERLYLSYNSITQINCDLFKTNTNLNTLTLISNNMTKISPTLFKGLNNLNWIDLSKNQLSSFDANQFKGLSKLSHLDFSFNQLTYLPNNLLADTIIGPNFATSAWAYNNPYKQCSTPRTDNVLKGSKICTSAAVSVIA